MPLTRTRKGLAAATALAALLLPSVAHANSPSRFVDFNKTLNAGADFDSTAGCVDTHVGIIGIAVLQATTVANGGVTHNAGANGFIEVAQFDHCTNTQLLDAVSPCCDGPSLEGLSVARDLTTATLNARMPVIDSVTNTTKNLTVRLAWTAIPPLTRDSFEFHLTDPGLTHLHFSDHGTGYGAEASGTVSDGATNYTPDTTENAFISSDVGTFVNIAF